MGEYHALACELEDMPLIPEEGIKALKYGPWQIFMDFAKAQRFAEAHSTMEVEGMTMEVKAYKVAADDADQPSIYAVGPTILSYVQDKGGWMEVSLDSDQAFIHLTASDVRKTLSKMSIRVFRCARMQAKMPEDEGAAKKDWLALGPGCRTQYVNATIKPKAGDMSTYDWPPVIEFEYAAPVAAFTARHIKRDSATPERLEAHRSVAQPGLAPLPVPCRPCPMLPVRCKLGAIQQVQPRQKHRGRRQHGRSMRRHAKSACARGARQGAHIGFYLLGGAASHCRCAAVGSPFQRPIRAGQGYCTARHGHKYTSMGTQV